jgi:hypothetical protein
LVHISRAMQIINPSRGDDGVPFLPQFAGCAHPEHQ